MPADEFLYIPESIPPYHYVDDGASVGPWLALRPWASVSLWEGTLVVFFAARAHNVAKRDIEGGCSRLITLWGNDANARSGTSPPSQCENRPGSLDPGVISVGPRRRPYSAAKIAGF